MSTSSALRSRRLHRAVTWHPEWPAYALAGLAWAGLVALAALADPAAHPTTGHHGSAPASRLGGPEPAAWLAALHSSAAHWALMVLATMLPLVAPQARLVALRSVWSRRRRAMSLFLAGYLAVWLAIGVAIVLARGLVGASAHGVEGLAAAVLVASGWHVSPRRRAVLRRCGAPRLGAPVGISADANCLSLGVQAAGRCLCTCLPLMIVMAMGHGLLLMAGLFAVLLSERMPGPNPASRVGRPSQVLATVALAVLSVVSPG